MISTVKLSILGCACLLGACATPTPIPDRIDLVNLKPSSDRVSLKDARPQSARSYRVIESGGTYRFFGDSSISPALLELFGSSRIADALPLAYRDTKVEVLRLDVGLWQDSVGADHADRLVRSIKCSIQEASQQALLRRALRLDMVSLPTDPESSGTRSLRLAILN